MRIWDAENRKQLSTYLFYSGKANVNIADMENQYKARSITANDANSLILVGFYDGSLGAYALTPEDFKIKEIRKWKLAAEWISDIKISPDQAYFAAGSHDNAIYIYKI